MVSRHSKCFEFRNISIFRNLTGYGNFFYFLMILKFLIIFNMDIFHSKMSELE